MKKNILRVLIAAVALAAFPFAQLQAGNTYADIVKAQVIISKIQKIVDKYNEMTIDLVPPEGIKGSKGKFYSPFKEDGSLTDWADKALNVQVGAAAGEKAGGLAGKALASKVPFGGLAAGKLKKQGKQMGAMAAIGGKKFVQKTTELSFNNVDELIVYMHAAHKGNPDYQKGVASVMAIHPEMENRVDYAITQAYRAAAKEQKKAAKEAKKKEK